MKRVLLFIFVIVVLWIGVFAYRNLRGIGPAVMPARQIPNLLNTDSSSKGPTTNTTGIPLMLPDGVSLSFFARSLGAPRVLRFDPKGVLLVSVPARGQVIALPDANGDGVADAKVVVASGLRSPHGLAFQDGKLFVAEIDQVAIFDYDTTTHIATNKRKIIDLPSGGNHVTRTIDVGPDGHLYISVGSSCNVCNEKDLRRAKILIADSDGGNLRDYATGLRNSVFFIWDAGGRMWATDMGRDLIGDDIPPDEINIIEDRGFYGWPYCYGKKIWDRQFNSTKDAEDRCAISVASYVDLQAHSAPLGLRFIPESWGKEYEGDLLISFHGSWNRTTPTGYKVVRIKLDKNGAYEGTEDFITGWLGSAKGASGAHGRPVDIIFDAKGVGYISDDKAGVVYRLEI